ncbi:MAG: PTS sugar transporter subunit IIA [Planctomycetes bacterium]|nr:PTS sugar transporter subunit IIA [Planctomycetota bacterium]
MKLLGFLSKDAVALGMKSVGKEDAIRELIQVLVDQGELGAEKLEPVLASVLEREAIGSTGLGDGIAIPHVKDCEHITGLTGVFGRSDSEAGIAFEAIDGKPVHLMFLILGGPETSDEHIQVLRKLAALRLNEHFLRFLKGAEGKEQVIETIQEMAGSIA